MIKVPKSVSSRLALSEFASALRLAGVDASHDALLTELQLTPANKRRELMQGMVDALPEPTDDDQQRLPLEFAHALDVGDFELSDLSNTALGLGDLGQYDLSLWEGA